MDEMGKIEIFCNFDTTRHLIECVNCPDTQKPAFYWLDL